MSMLNYINMDCTMEHLNDEIETIDGLIGEHIQDGVGITGLRPLARLRANLSVQRIELREAMDHAESHDEVHMDVEELDFDSESTLSGMGFISVETIR